MSNQKGTGGNVRKYSNMVKDFSHSSIFVFFINADFTCVAGETVFK